MSDTTFIPGTVIQASWLNDINDNVYLAAGGTANTLPRTVQQKFAEVVSVKDFGAIGNGIANDTAAFNFALSASNSVYVPPGTYLLGSTVTLNSGKSLFGVGRQAGQSVLKASGNNYPVLTIPGGTTGATAKGLRLERSVNAVAGGDGVLVNGTSEEVVLRDLLIIDQYNGISVNSTDIAYVQDVEIWNCFNDGFFQTNSAGYGPAQWHLHNVTAQGCNGWGFHVASSLGVGGGLIMGDWAQIRTFANTLGGIGLIGAGVGSGIHDTRITTAFIGGDGNTEVYLDTYGNDHILSDIFVELSGQGATGRSLSTPASGVGSGFNFSANNQRISLCNSRSVNNSDSGLRSLATNLILTGFQTAGNGQNLASVIRRGIDIEGGNAVITGCITSFELFGLVVAVDAVAVSACDFTGASTPFNTSVTLVNSSIVACRPNTIGNYLQGGIVLGNPTGGNAGVGTLNTAAGLLKNNVAYNNP